MIAADYMNVYSEDEETVLSRVNERFLDRYSVYAMANYKNGNKFLSKTVKRRFI